MVLIPRSRLILITVYMQLELNFQGPPTSAVILKFELMYAPMLENGSVAISLDIACEVIARCFSYSVLQVSCNQNVQVGLAGFT